MLSLSFQAQKSRQAQPGSKTQLCQAWLCVSLCPNSAQQGTVEGEAQGGDFWGVCAGQDDPLGPFQGILAPIIPFMRYHTDP